MAFLPSTTTSNLLIDNARAYLFHFNISRAILLRFYDWEMERSDERVHRRQIGDSDASRPCACQPLHDGCDLDLCEKASNPPLNSWIENDGPAETIFLYGRAEQWADGAERGCMTCAAVTKLAGTVRPEERVSVQRKARECSIFGQYVYKDRNDRESCFIQNSYLWLIGIKLK
jgi:hypothetical protein